MIDFIAPEFVQENDADAIQARMMKALPSDIDDMPGGFPYDFTMPTAIEKSSLIQYTLVQTLMLMFPMWAWGKWLDYHAANVGLSRKEAVKASGILRIEGTPGTIIPSGTIFSVSGLDTLSLEYESAETAVIGEESVAELRIIAVQTGTQYNVRADTITLMKEPVKEVAKVCNPKEIEGGRAAEEDAELRKRIQEFNETRSASFIGNNSDYIRWAKETDGAGIGSVIVMPVKNEPGKVKLVLMDEQGQPADNDAKQKVYQHIVSPDDPINRLAPIGAIVEVAAPEVKDIRYKANIMLKAGYDLESVKESFQKNLSQYYETAKAEGRVKYNHVSSYLFHTEGVEDFEGLLIDGGTENIEILSDVYPGINLEGFEVKI